MLNGFKICLCLLLIKAITFKQIKALNKKNEKNPDEKKYKAKENARLRRQKWKEDFSKISAERMKSLERMRKSQQWQKDINSSVESNHSSFANVQDKGKYI